MNSLLKNILDCIENKNGGFNKEYIEYVGKYIKNRVRGDYTVADVGCGTGVLFSIPFYFFYGKNDNSLLQFDCYDVDSASIDFGNNAVCDIFGTQEKIAFKVLKTKKNEDAFDKDLLPIKDRYDIVTCNMVLEHTRKPEKLLQFCTGILKNEGILFISIPNGFGPYEIDSFLYRSIYLPVFLALRKIKRLFIPPKPVNNYWGGVLYESLDAATNHHVQFFTQRRLKILFKNVGLTVMIKRHFLFLSGPLYGTIFKKDCWINKLNNCLAGKIPFCLGNVWCYVLTRGRP